MIVATIAADIAHVKEGIIAHGVNCQGIMGAGVAKELADIHPAMLERYKVLCEEGSIMPGTLWIYRTNESFGAKHPFSTGSGLRIINMATQEFYGPMGRAKLEWIEECVKKLEMSLEVMGTQSLVYIPKIGCGLGGLDWNDVSKIFEASPVKFVVCERMRCIIAGSRAFYNVQMVFDVINSCPFKDEISNVVSGRANGVDIIGSLWAFRNRKVEMPFFADWDQGKSAGPARNLIMAKNADALIAMPCGESRGTNNMIETARKMGLKTHVVEFEERHLGWSDTQPDYMECKEVCARMDRARGIVNPHKKS
jgi:O-acetyl-ADP-ribose deacetylase (regulator of RNase III)